MTTKNVRSKMREMNEHMNDFQTSGHSASAKDEAFTASSSNTSSGKGDYIDFEEIK